MKKCRNYLPVGPFDQVGPRMRAGLAQTDIMFGGFIVRSNPIGAIFDAVRAFCSPMPMQEDGSDGYAAADAGYSTPELTSFDAGSVAPSQPLDSAWFGPPQPATYQNCGAGSMWDAGLSACVPQSTAQTPQTDPTGLDATAAARTRLQTAIAANNSADVRGVYDLAVQNQGTQKRSPVYQRWNQLAHQALNWLNSHKGVTGKASVKV